MNDPQMHDANDDAEFEMLHRGRLMLVLHRSPYPASTADGYLNERPYPASTADGYLNERYMELPGIKPSLIMAMLRREEMARS